MLRCDVPDQEEISELPEQIHPTVVVGAAQPARAADAASGPKIVRFLSTGFGPKLVSIYRCGAADAQSVELVGLRS